jgi:uncharacterized protein YaiI (UPF0178 family)
MHIWVDGDACPVIIKEILFRAAVRTKIGLTVVANQPMQIPRSEFISIFTVRSGLNVADQHIVDSVAAGDLVVTADIPLAALVVAKGAIALDPRGALYTESSIGERLAMRNLMDELRGSGLVAGGPAPLTSNDRQSFANQLDRLITKSRSK